MKETKDLRCPLCEGDIRKAGVRVDFSPKKTSHKQQFQCKVCGHKTVNPIKIKYKQGEMTTTTDIEMSKREAHLEKERKRGRCWYKDHLEYERSRGRAKNQRIKVEVLSHYSGGIPHCTICRESRLVCLSIDHIRGGGNKHKKDLGIKVVIYQWLKGQGYPSGYQVLCMNCQFAKRIENKELRKAGLIELS